MSRTKRRYLLGAMLAVAMALVALAAFSLHLGGSTASSGDRLEYAWSPAEQAQFELAIERRDTSLLPECTDDYYQWREETKPLREAAGDAPFTMDFWEAPGCKGKPDRVVPGPNRRSEGLQFQERPNSD